MGAVLSAVMELEQSNGVLVLNTPHKTVEMLTETAEPNAKMLLTAECIETMALQVEPDYSKRHVNFLKTVQKNCEKALYSGSPKG